MSSLPYLRPLRLAVVACLLYPLARASAQDVDAGAPMEADAGDPDAAAPEAADAAVQDAEAPASPEPSPTPTPDPTPTPTPDPTPSPSPVPSPDPIPSPVPSPDPAPSPEPSAEADAQATAEADSTIHVTVVGTSLARTPGSAHVVRSKQLERFEHDDPHAVLTAVPGVYARGEDGVGLRPNVGIRGVNPDRSKKVTLMEDGVLFGPAPYSAPAAYYFPILTRMSQVRVIKGPAAVAHGPQTVGGAIDLVTRPIPSSTSGGLDLSIGEYLHRKVHAHAGSSDGQIGFLVEGVHLASDGFKHLPGGGDTGFYRNEYMFKGSYLIDPEAAVSNELRLKLTYSEELSNETYLGLTDADFEADPLQRYGASMLDRMRNHRTSIVATHVVEPSDDLTVTTDVYRHDYHRIWRKVNRFRGANLFEVLTSPDTPVNEVYHGLLSGELDADENAPGQELLIGPNEREYVSQGVQSRLRWDANTGPVAHRVELGLRLHNDRIERHHSEAPFLLTGGEPFPEQDALPVTTTARNEAKSYALAAHATDAITWQALTLTPGVRFEAIRSTDDNILDETESSRWAHALLPGLGVYYAIIPELGVLAGAYRGFSPPEPGSDDDVDPELSINYEAGARFTHGPARAELIGFFNDYSNLSDVCTFSSGCDPDDVDRQFNAGEARIYGLEAFVDYEIPARPFTVPLTIGYTLTHAEFRNTFDSSDPIFGEVERGDEMPYIPRHQLTAAVGLEHERAGGNVAVTYLAAMREEAGSEPLSDALATDEQFLLDVSAYVRALSWLQFYATARNLLNAHYIVSHRPFGARPNAPRIVLVGSKLEF